MNAYFNYMVDMSVLFGAKKEVALKELRESLEFEMALANVSTTYRKGITFLKTFFYILDILAK